MKPYNATYQCWLNMMARCYRPSSTRYERYGGRGITVCERWQSFENFLADMGEKPARKSLDRINNDGHYEPGNCRWTDSRTQSMNTRRSLEDISGQRHGMWTVIAMDSKRTDGTYWLCQCDCGSRKAIRRGSLESGNSYSCGCYQRKRTPESPTALQAGG